MEATFGLFSKTGGLFLPQLAAHIIPLFALLPPRRNLRLRLQLTPALLMLDAATATWRVMGLRCPGTGHSTAPFSACAGLNLVFQPVGWHYRPFRLARLALPAT